MYYTKQKGFGPFKRWALMEKVTPRHKEEEVKLRNGFLYTEGGKRPISSAQITIDKDGFIVFEGTGRTSVRAKSFEAYSNGYVFRTDEGTQGYVARNGNVVNPVQKGYTYKDGATITGVEVSGKMLVFQKVANDGNIFYTVGDALSGLEVFPGKYTSYSFGDREEGIPGKFIILGNKDGTKTIVNHAWAMLGENITKYAKCDETLYLLSNTPKNPNGHKTVLEGYPIATATTGTPTLKFLQYGVTEFDIDYRELITYDGKHSTVYDVSPYEKGTIVPRFTREGKVRNIAPMFDEHDFYMLEKDGERTVLLEDGTPCNNPELKGLKAIGERHGFAYVIDVETKDGLKHGVVRTKDLSTLLPPQYDRVKFLGRDEDEEKLCLATVGQTFRVNKFIPACVSGQETLYTSETLVPLNQYEKPQLIKNEPYKLYVSDSVDDCMVLDMSGEGNRPVACNAAVYASKQLGIPLPTKDVEFVKDC